MSGEPIVEERLFDVTSGFHLQRNPVLVPIVVDDHRQMTHHGAPREPLTFDQPVGAGVYKKEVSGLVRPNPTIRYSYKTCGLYFIYSQVIASYLKAVFRVRWFEVEVTAHCLSRYMF